MNDTVDRFEHSNTEQRKSLLANRSFLSERFTKSSGDEDFAAFREQPVTTMFPEQPTTPLQRLASNAVERLCNNDKAMGGFEWQPRPGRTTVIKVPGWELRPGWEGWECIEVPGEDHMSIVTAATTCAFFSHLGKALSTTPKDTTVV